MDEKKSKKIRLRPVIYPTNRIKHGAQNTTQQMFLLKALQVTSDPKKLKEIIGVKTVAEVYRTLDKLAMRKEYHKALGKAGISFDYITRGIKGIAETSEKDDTRLKALQTLLKSVGMEKYDVETTETGGTWEDILLEKIEEQKKEKEEKKDVVETDVVDDDIYEKDTKLLGSPDDYDVEVPEIPEEEKVAQKHEDDLTSSIYE